MQPRTALTTAVRVRPRILKQSLSIIVSSGKWAFSGGDVSLFRPRILRGYRPFDIILKFFRKRGMTDRFFFRYFCNILYVSRSNSKMSMSPAHLQVPSRLRPFRYGTSYQRREICACSDASSCSRILILPGYSQAFRTIRDLIKKVGLEAGGERPLG